MTSLLPPSEVMFIVRVLNFMEQEIWTRLLAKFTVIFYVWCCYSTVAYVHLRLQLQLQHLHPSVYNYIDYSSAVNLVALHVNLVRKYRASSDTYRSTLQSSSFIDSGCYPLLKLVKRYISSTHCSVPDPWSLHCTVQWLRRAFICIASWQCRDSSATLRNTLTFNLNCIVVF